MEATTSSGVAVFVDIPYSWLEDNGLVVSGSDAAAHEAALASTADADSDGLPIAAGFKAVIKGTTDLSAALSAWEVVTETRTSTCRFFRVEIVPEN